MPDRNTVDSPCLKSLSQLLSSDSAEQKESRWYVNECVWPCSMTWQTRFGLQVKVFPTLRQRILLTSEDCDFWTVHFWLLKFYLFFTSRIDQSVISYLPNMTVSWIDRKKSISVLTILVILGKAMHIYCVLLKYKCNKASQIEKFKPAVLLAASYRIIVSGT